MLPGEPSPSNFARWGRQVVERVHVLVDALYSKEMHVAAASQSARHSANDGVAGAAPLLLSSFLPTHANSG